MLSFLRALLRITLRTCLKVRTHGFSISSSLPSKLLVVANHQSWLDLPLVGLLLPFPVVIAVSPHENRGVLKWILRLLPHVEIDQAERFSVKRLARLLEKGRPVLVFPEAHVTRTGSLIKLYDTAALAAMKTDATILPLSIEGLAATCFGEAPRTKALGLRPLVHLTAHPLAKLAVEQEGSLKTRRRRAALGMQALMQAALAAGVPARTLFGAFLDAIERVGRGFPILEDGKEKPRTYGDLLKGSLALSRVLSRLTASGETVGVLMPNATATVILFFGLHAAGRTPAMINFTAGSAAIRSACRAARVRRVITSRRFLDALREQGVQLQLDGAEVHYLEDLRQRISVSDKFWLLVRALRHPRSVVPAQNPQAPAVVLFTSGSEGTAKGVVLSHANILANIDQMAAVIGFTPADKFLNALPMYHSYSLTACTIMPLVRGTKVLLYPTPLHYHVIPELAYTKACTFLFGTSTFLGHYARHAHPYDFHTVRVVVSGAEKLDEDVAKTWLRKFGLRITEGYGATECAPVIALNAPLAYKQGTVGRLLPGIDHRIVPVPGISTGGELHLRGPNVMLGYLLPANPGVLVPPRSELGEGWYATGDIVELDADRFISVRGRAKRFAKIAGEMVSLEVVERIARHASPDHQHAASVQMLSELGESTVLFTTDPLLTRSVLHQSARALGSQELAVARTIVHVKELPLLGSGKTDYFALQKLVEGGLKQSFNARSESGTVVPLRVSVPGS